MAHGKIIVLVISFQSNHSDERSASTSPSPVEEFKEPDTKPGFKGRTSRVSARARSISPSLAAAMATMSEKKSDALSRGSKKKKLRKLHSSLLLRKKLKHRKNHPLLRTMMIATRKTR